MTYDYTQDLLKFIQRSPSPYHTVQASRTYLDQAGRPWPCPKPGTWPRTAPIMYPSMIRAWSPSARVPMCAVTCASARPIRISPVCA